MKIIIPTDNSFQLNGSSLDSNPIFNLYKSVDNKKLSKLDAFQKARSINFLKNLNEEHYSEIFQLINHHAKKQPEEGLFLSKLSLACVESCTISDKILGEAHLNCGVALNLLGFFEESRAEIEKAKYIFKNNYDDKWFLAYCDFEIANLYYSAQDYKRAIGFYSVVINQFESLGDRFLAAMAKMNLGSVYQNIGDAERALKNYNEANKIFTELEEREFISICVSNIFATYISNKKYDQALKFFDLKKDSFDKLDSNLKAGIYYELSNIFFEKTNYRKSLEYLFRAKKIFERSNDEFNIINCTVSICEAYLYLGRKYQNSKYMDKAISIYTRKRDLFNAPEFREINNGWDFLIVEAYLGIGDIDKAIKLHMEKRPEAINLGKYSELAKKELTLALVLESCGNYEKALAFHKLACALFVFIGDEPSLRRSEMGIAGIYFRLGNQDQSLNLFYKVRSYFLKKNMDYELANCELGIGNNYVALSRHKRAICYYTNALALFESIKAPFDKANIQHNLGCAYMNNKDYRRAKLHFAKSMKFFNQLGHDNERLLKSKLTLAKLLFNKKKYEQAINIFAELTQYKPFKLIVIQAFRGLGHSYGKLGIIDSAIDNFLLAVEEVEKTLKNYKFYEIKDDFLGTIKAVYYELIGAFLQKKNFIKALEYLEQFICSNTSQKIIHRNYYPTQFPVEKGAFYKNLYSRHQTILSKITNGELIENRGNFTSLQFKDLNTEETLIDKGLEEQRVNINFPDKFSLDYEELKSISKDQKAAIIYLFPMFDQTVIFAVINGIELPQTTFIIKDYSASDLSKDIKYLYEPYAMFAAGKKRTGSKELKEKFNDRLEEKLAQLYGVIIEPIKRSLKRVKKIVFIPFGEFSWMPLHGMWCLRNGQKKYLVDDFSICYSPSGKILKSCQTLKRYKKDKLLSVFSNPKSTQSLYFSEIESKNLLNMFDKSAYLNQPTINELIEKSKNANIIHYAGHATYDSLVLNDPKSSNNHKEYSTEYVSNYFDLLECYLVVLSGCHTGSISMGKVDASHSMTTAFLYAGAPTVISTLWGINDLATNILIQKMYGYIKKGFGKAEALRRSQLWLKDPEKRQQHISTMKDKNSKGIEKIIPDFSKLIYWLPFILTGAD